MPVGIGWTPHRPQTRLSLLRNRLITSYKTGILYFSSKPLDCKPLSNIVCYIFVTEGRASSPLLCWAYPLAVPVGKLLPQEVGHERPLCYQTADGVRVDWSEAHLPRAFTRRGASLWPTLAPLLQASLCNGALFKTTTTKERAGSIRHEKPTPAARLFSSSLSQHAESAVASG